MRALFGALMLLAAVTAACSGPLRLSLAPSQDVSADDYGDVLEDWTRDDEIYNVLDSVMFVHATFHSPTFRKAFLLKFPDVYGPGSDEANRIMLTDPNAELGHEFFVSVVTNDHKWNDLHEEENSIWRVMLIGQDGQVVPGDVERVKTTANIRRIYPYITDFARTYRIVFPLAADGEPLITSETEEFTLRIASALGAAEMTWHLKN